LESIIQFSYEIAGFNRIEALTNLDAAPSMNLLIKLGFKQDGILRGYASFQEGYIDQRCFSLLKSDWQKKSAVIY
ncbi:GNAT family N-acetyltransferase, partial [Paenibacillus sp. Soil522]|uniref:GNAT family N-acetyltransferase n=1 Tax=Paenibacillus sp. Soil522 TaxID=1736388 RepID=UPI001F1E7CE7